MMKDGEKIKKIDMNKAGLQSGVTDKRAPPSAKEIVDNVEDMNLIDTEGHVVEISNKDRNFIRRKSIDNKKRKKSVDDGFSEKDVNTHDNLEVQPTRRKSVSNPSAKDGEVQANNTQDSASGRPTNISPTNIKSSPDRVVALPDPSPISVKNRGSAIMTIESIESNKVSVKSDHKSNPTPKNTGDSKKRDKTFGKPKETALSRFLFGEPKITPGSFEETK
eukprot:CAMPEP_0174822360 /NCGR_PEP_ID=MMETSP1107-20130205/15249_1 /TAXON_ID=36770 /ORGANISM="Paraphysomonas vestita, Strain GFlagA" /LENGTH=219 /DNA_ID=CAMNT_0016041059 /DNA_START=278 /DNA_END=937 /DNA_ORIENTATION=-